VCVYCLERKKPAGAGFFRAELRGESKLKSAQELHEVLLFLLG
jgi:hypothetical protein